MSWGLVLVSELRPEDPQAIGPYRLVGELGQGGMGRVYLGVSPGGRPVAVKAIRAELAADPEFRARFGREVASARRVSGVYTAQVVDADVDGPVAWMATAYVPGPSLAEAVDQHGPLPEPSLLALAAGLAESLNAIHAAGVVHRDLKPSNVLLAEDGPRVIDFGISRAVEAATMLTQAGLVVGSPGFMSPEQAMGGEVGPPSDIFNLGAVLAFAATGEGPFGTGTTAALLYRVVHGLPDLERVPPRVRPLIERCLAKSPGERPTASGLLGEVGALQPDGDWLPEAITRTFVAGSPSRPGFAPAGGAVFAPTGGPGYAPSSHPGAAPSSHPDYAPSSHSGYASSSHSGYASSSHSGYASSSHPGCPSSHPGPSVFALRIRLFLALRWVRRPFFASGLRPDGRPRSRLGGSGARSAAGFRVPAAHSASWIRDRPVRRARGGPDADGGRRRLHADASAGIRPADASPGVQPADVPAGKRAAYSSRRAVRGVRAGRREPAAAAPPGAAAHAGADHRRDARGYRRGRLCRELGDEAHACSAQRPSGRRDVLGAGVFVECAEQCVYVAVCLAQRPVVDGSGVHAFVGPAGGRDPDPDADADQVQDPDADPNADDGYPDGNGYRDADGNGYRVDASKLSPTGLVRPASSAPSSPGVVGSRLRFRGELGAVQPVCIADARSSYPAGSAVLTCSANLCQAAGATRIKGPERSLVSRTSTPSAHIPTSMQSVPPFPL